jgi:hypothetical protein
LQQQLKTLGMVLAVGAFAATGDAQTARQAIFVTNSYELKVQQFSAGSLANGSRYVAFGGEARAVNKKEAADLKSFAFTLFYDIDASGTASVTDGTFLIQTTTRDRSLVTVGGDIVPGATLNLRAGAIGAGQKLSLSIVGGEDKDITGVISASTDKSNPPRVVGTLTLTYPVVQ